MINRYFFSRSRYLVSALGLLAAIAPNCSNAQEAPIRFTAEAPRVAFDGTFDQTTFGTSFDVNALLPLGGHLGESGFRFRLTAATSSYRYITNPSPRTLGFGRSHEGDFLAGYQVVVPKLSVLLAAGPVIVSSEDDLGVHRGFSGAKAAVTAYATPTDDTMLFARSTYLTIGKAYDFQIKGGARLFGVGYFGPDFKYSGREGEHGYRFGPHLSGIAIGPLAVSLAAGWLSSSQLGTGHYFTASFYAAF